MITTKPHHEAKKPYGYKFDAIDLHICTWDEAHDIFCELREDHHTHDIQIGQDNPHAERITWEIASHIEGNFGLPYKATIVRRDTDIWIYTPKNDRWWTQECRTALSNYLMGLRALLDLL